MPLIPAVGRKTPKVRLLLAVVYLLLALGAVSTVYPFLIMLGSSVTSAYDQNENAVVPSYLRSDRALFGKYAEDKYDGDPAAISAAYGHTFATLQDVAPPAHVDSAQARDWDAFFAAQPLTYKHAGFGGDPASYSPSLLQDRYRDYLRARFKGDVGAMDRLYTQEDTTFLTVMPPFEKPSNRTFVPGRDPKSADWQQFQQSLPARFFQPVLADPIYSGWLNQERYDGKIADLNTAWGTTYATFADIPYAAHPAGNAAQQADWVTFTRTRLPILFLRVAPSAAGAYRQFLKSRYHDDYAQYAQIYGVASSGTPPSGWSSIGLPSPAALPSTGRPLVDYLDFIHDAVPPPALSADTLDLRYRAHASSLGMSGPQKPPIAESDWLYVQSHSGDLRRDFAARNYRLVLQYLLLHGRAFWVTVLYCSLAVLTALIVNPLCAYALSRFNLPYGSNVLLFLLATMAFPAEVSQIPNFLLLKQLGWLNSFYALILPGAANGYAIFLLKGFFDSLPRELYEAGRLDGASEMRMFFQITVPLSKPIFAVIALAAFTAAYSNFLFAMITCPNPRMWTLMVWVYEMQSGGAPNYVLLAALTLTSIPTLLVFILAQNTIMRGIIVPTEK